MSKVSEFKNAQYLKYTLLAVFAFVVSACGSSQYSDLDKYIANVKNKTKGSVQPLPVVSAAPGYVYGAEKLRDPFSPAGIEVIPIQPTPSFLTGYTPEALEAFSLDSLSFVGLLEKNGGLWALVRTPDESIHRVSVGNRMGKNYGEILSITATAIVMKEYVADNRGGFIERAASLALSD